MLNRLPDIGGRPPAKVPTTLLIKLLAFKSFTPRADGPGGIVIAFRLDSGDDGLGHLPGKLENVVPPPLKGVTTNDLPRVEIAQRGVQSETIRSAFEAAPQTVADPMVQGFQGRHPA